MSEPLTRSASPTAAIIQAGVTGAIYLGAAIGAGVALGEAADLFATRRDMANQFQDQHEFPNDLTTTTPFYISFLFQIYIKRSINNSPFLRSRGTIRLPIPDNLSDVTSVTYSTEKGLTPAIGAGLDEFAGRNRQESDFNNLRTIAAASITAGGLATLQNNVGGLADAARAYSGVTLNPYQTVLFEKPNFKTHTFTWKLIPKNEVESNTIRNMIRTFQYHTLPGVSESPGLFFTFPSMVTVSLFPSSQYLYRFKPCVIKAVKVSYAETTPSFYRGTNAPTAITIALELTEIEYFTNKDYTGNSFDDNTALASQASLSAIRPVNNPGAIVTPGAQQNPSTP